jgi:hypothetical protein
MAARAAGGAVGGSEAMAVIGIGTTSRASVEDVLAIVAAAREGVAGEARSQSPAGCELRAYSERSTPHPVPLPLGEGTPAQRLQHRPLSHGERDRVRGDSLCSVHNIAALAALDRPALNAVLQEAAQRAGLDLILLPLDELRAAAHLCVTHSEHSMKQYGIPSVAEAAALAGAGAGARLIVPRIVGANVTASVAGRP